MDEQYKFDGKIHFINNKYGYILRRTYENNDTEEDIDKMKVEFLKKYADYIIKTNLEKAIIILAREFYNEKWNPFVSFIQRSRNQCSYLNQYGTLGLKFERESFHREECLKYEEKYEET